MLFAVLNFEETAMNLFELIFFIINVTCGFLVGKYIWVNFGWIYSPISFLLGFILPIVTAFTLVTLYSLWIKIFLKAKQ
jgi:hypothetical protein